MWLCDCAVVRVVVCGRAGTLLCGCVIVRLCGCVRGCVCVGGRLSTCRTRAAVWLCAIVYDYVRGCVGVRVGLGASVDLGGRVGI